MDNLHADGAVAGFFCYPLDTLREKEGTQKIFDFRDKLEEVFTTGDGPEVLTLTGGATGLYCGYVDFIAWDIQEALNMAKEFFEGTDIPWAIFHTFRREAGSVIPKSNKMMGPETENQDDELDETLTGMDYIPYTQQNDEAFFHSAGAVERRGRVHPLYPGTECHPRGLEELPHRLRPGTGAGELRHHRGS